MPVADIDDAPGTSEVEGLRNRLVAALASATMARSNRATCSTASRTVGGQIHHVALFFQAFPDIGSCLWVVFDHKNVQWHRGLSLLGSHGQP